MFFSFSEDGCFYCPIRFDVEIAGVLGDGHRWNHFGFWAVVVVGIFYLIRVGAFFLWWARDQCLSSIARNSHPWPRVSGRRQGMALRLALIFFLELAGGDLRQLVVDSHGGGLVLETVADVFDSRD